MSRAQESSGYSIRFAEARDAGHIYRFICELAAYERESHKVKVTPAMIGAQLASPRPPFECLIAECNGLRVGCAIFFPNYSTWKGTAGMYLEDLYVEPSHRKGGVGKMLLQRLAAIAIERGYSRMDWSVLNWNESMHGFCRSLGAVPMEEWTTWRLDQPAMAALVMNQ